MNLKTWQIGVAMAVAVGAMLQMEIAQASKTEVILKADNAAEFSTIAVTVQQGMLPGGRFEFVDQKEHDTVTTRLADMQALFDKYGTVAQMEMNRKVQLFNDQEAVNAILTQRDDERLVCTHDAPLGSHIPRTACQTYGEIERTRRGEVQYLSNLKQVADFMGHLNAHHTLSNSGGH